MSDPDPFSRPQVPVITREQARDIARGYKALANHFRDIGQVGEAQRNERQSDWWLNDGQTRDKGQPETRAE